MSIDLTSPHVVNSMTFVSLPNQPVSDILITFQVLNQDNIQVVRQQRELVRDQGFIINNQVVTLTTPTQGIEWIEIAEHDGTPLDTRTELEQLRANKNSKRSIVIAVVTLVATVILFWVLSQR